MNYKKKVALVTGSSKGIGLGVAREFLQQGYCVAVTSRSADTAKTTAHLLSEETGGYCEGFAYDMNDPAAPANLITELLAQFGRLDVLVNNALANTINAPILETPDEVLDAAIIANISSAIKLCKHAQNALLVTGGNVVTIGSSITNRYVSGLPLYAMLKSGLEKLTQALAADWAAQGIRLNVVNPGFTHSGAAKDLGLNDEQIAGLYQYLAQFQPLGTAQPQDVAGVVSFLASDSAAKITGAVFDVDGGHRIQGHSLFPQ
ncbi:3-oxoacyl-[acyl-carrier-protein] reductase [Alteromonadaceae bacterium 2753L.S.0a.02]|nr:3-oxoacyl-[acyl-carrier-protein] reductase [Alteromonadaceae bacterium 2753L.S.0a.02]